MPNYKKYKKKKVSYEQTEEQKELKRKVDALEKTVEVIISSGKEIPSSLADELSRAKAKLSPNKFNARKLIYKDTEYDSAREAAFAKKLNERGIVFDYQVEVELQPAFETETEKIKPIYIVVDFLVNYDYFIDVKGIVTQHFSDKWKMLKYKFQKSKKYIVVKSEKDFDKIIDGIKNEGWKTGMSSLSSTANSIEVEL